MDEGSLQSSAIQALRGVQFKEWCIVCARW
jgi:hypothetical protein